MGGVIGKIGGLLGGAVPAAATTIIQAAPRPAPTPLAQAIPTRADTSAAEEADRKRRRAAIGRASQNPTGDEGVTGAASVGRPTLLGGAAKATGA